MTGIYDLILRYGDAVEKLTLSKFLGAPTIDETRAVEDCVKQLMDVFQRLAKRTTGQLGGE